MLIGCYGHNGRIGQLGKSVGRHVTNGRIGQKLHDHADVIGHGRKHHWAQVQSWASWWVRLHQELRRSLAEMADLIFDGLSHDGVGNRLEVYWAFVCQVVKDICGSHCFRTWGRNGGFSGITSMQSRATFQFKQAGWQNGQNQSVLEL